MGMGMSYKCKKCGYEQKFFQGIGMMHTKENLMDENSICNLLDFCPEGDKEKVRKMMNSNEYHLEDTYGYDMYECPNCKKLYNKYDFTLISNTNSEDNYTPHYLCEDCKIELVKILRLEKCPKCGEPFDFSSSHHLLWD